MEGEKETEKKSTLERLKSMSPKAKTRWLAIFVAAAAILLIYFSSFAPGGKTTASLNDGLEKKLAAALSDMEGIGRVSVVINYESSGEKIPATSTDTEVSDEQSRQSTEITTVSGEALIVKETQPEVRGVIVVAEGAEDIGARMNMVSAVTTLLGISADKVEILY